MKDALFEWCVLKVRAQAINPDVPLTSSLYDSDQNAKFSEISLQEKQLCVEKDFEIKKLQQQLELRKMESQFEKERQE